jgi:hypothetical protein
VVISWYLVPSGAHLAAAKPVLVTTGRATIRSAGTITIKLKLTPAGRRLLVHAKRLALTAKGAFTPNGEAPIDARKTFTLKR